MSESRDMQVSNRRGYPKPKTIAKKRLTRKEMLEGRELLPLVEYRRPRLRSECKDGPRPCPFVSCRYHLFLDVNPETGSIKIKFPDLEVWEMPFSCALDVADQGGITLEEIGFLMNLTRERVRQIEASALAAMKKWSMSDSSE